MDASYHLCNLANHCRLCGTAFPRRCRDKKRKEDIADLVLACHHVDVTDEDEQVYPEYICYRCCSQMRTMSQSKGKKYTNPSVMLFEWLPHCSDCKVCHHFATSKKGGRPKKVTKNRGRPSGETTSQTVAHIRGIAGPSHVSAAVDPSYVHNPPIDCSKLLCHLCHLVVNGPVQSVCEKVVCAGCLINSLMTSGPNTCCPSCNTPVSTVHFKKCQGMVCDVIASLQVKCRRGCHLSIPMEQLESHEESCGLTVSPQPPRSSRSDMTIRDMLAAPVDAPLCHDEKIACTHLVRRALQESKSPDTLVLKTGGQVSYM